MRKKNSVKSAITEQTAGGSTRTGVCPRVVSLNKNGKYQQVTVKIFKAKVLTIKPKTPLCELHELKVLRNINPLSPEEENSEIKINQHTAENLETAEEFKLLEGIDLSDTTASLEQKQTLEKFLYKWKHLFSKNIMDTGNCNCET